jgi:hypothetical protein
MSIPLRFPGNALTRVAPGTRFEMFPSDAHMEAEELIEYYIGAPPVCFAISRRVIPAGSFLERQMARGLKDVQNEGGVTKVLLEGHAPLLFPLVFAYLNQLFADPRTAALPTTGLSDDEAERFTQLVNGFLLVENPQQSLLFKRPPFDGVRLRVHGRLFDPNSDTFRAPFMVRLFSATISPEGVITCVPTHFDVTSTVTIDLRRIPTAYPWPRSIVEHAVRAMADDEQDDHLVRNQFQVDNVTSFFVPAQAISCRMHDGTYVVCEGVFRCEKNEIYLHSVCQFKWLWLRVEVV